MTNYRGLSIPHTRMGSGGVTSDNLFDPNEQVIFDFYAANYSRYRRVLDVGANIGVHSILMARQGWDVRAFEPDPDHFARLLENVAANGVVIEATRAAVSVRYGTAPFVRVLGNTTGSHLVGARQSYGPSEVIAVPTVDCRPLFRWADFAKIDCEGSEAVLVLATDNSVWRHLDAVLEVGSPENASAIYRYLRDLVPMWAQKVGWARVRSVDDVPAHHSEGSLFIGRSPPFERISA